MRFTLWPDCPIHPHTTAPSTSTPSPHSAHIPTPSCCLIWAVRSSCSSTLRPAPCVPPWTWSRADSTGRMIVPELTRPPPCLPWLPGVCLALHPLCPALAGLSGWGGRSTLCTSEVARPLPHGSPPQHASGPPSSLRRFLAPPALPPARPVCPAVALLCPFAAISAGPVPPGTLALSLANAPASHSCGPAFGVPPPQLPAAGWCALPCIGRRSFVCRLSSMLGACCCRTRSSPTRGTTSDLACHYAAYIGYN